MIPGWLCDLLSNLTDSRECQSLDTLLHFQAWDLSVRELVWAVLSVSPFSPPWPRCGQCSRRLGIFSKAVCVTHWLALWWVRLRPGSDDSSKLCVCLCVQGICVQGFNLGLVMHHVLKIFAFAWVDVCMEWSGLKQNIVRGTQLQLTWLCVCCQTALYDHQLELPSGWCETPTPLQLYTGFVLLTRFPKAATVPPDTCSFAFSLTYNVALNLSSLFRVFCIWAVMYYMLSYCLILIGCRTNIFCV